MAATALRPTHDGTQEVIVVAAHGLLAELLPLPPADADLLESRVDAAHDGEGVAVLADEPDRDLEIIAGSWITSPLLARHHVDAPCSRRPLS